MAFECLEDLWRNCLINKGWSERVSLQLQEAWAPSTRKLYNDLLNKCARFCKCRSILFPPVETKDLADFLCELADCSDAPRSQLNSATAALGAIYSALDMPNITHSQTIQLLVTARVKSSTKRTAKKSSVMPIAPFRSLFQRWGCNDTLSLKHLRIKTITLLALLLMLRPSDIAPMSTEFDPETKTTRRRVFTVDQVQFSEEHMSISFHGTKNDTDRSGFMVDIPKADEE